MLLQIASEKAVMKTNKQRWLKYSEVQQEETQKMMKLWLDESKHNKFRISYMKCDHIIDSPNLEILIVRRGNFSNYPGNIGRN